jgi:long-chain-fatty-acid---luciferin-component ligase
MSEFNKKYLSDLAYIMLNLDEILSDNLLYKEVQQNIIKTLFLYHLENNKGYQDYCTLYSQENMEKNFNLSSIPLIPSSFFKKRDINLTSVMKEDIIKQCTSSGTQGSISIVPRDEETLTNFLGSITSSTSCLFDLDKVGNHKAFVLGPTPEESGDLWFSYVLSSMALNFKTEYFENDGIFNINDVIINIQKAIEKDYEIVIVGPPFRIVELCNQLNKLKIPVCLNGRSFIISAGGWKDRQNKAISRENYANIVSNTFKIKQSFIRDSFNMVELNTVLNECEYHEKHVLPWVDVIARAPQNNKPLDDNQMGILSFYDASALSYPCFILSEDYGITISGKCKCGRHGKRIKIIKRMNRIESRGCALKMGAFDKKQKMSHHSKRYFKSFFRDPALYLREKMNNK